MNSRDRTELTKSIGQHLFVCIQWKTTQKYLVGIVDQIRVTAFLWQNSSPSKWRLSHCLKRRLSLGMDFNRINLENIQAETRWLRAKRSKLFSLLAFKDADGDNCCCWCDCDCAVPHWFNWLPCRSWFSPKNCDNWFRRLSSCRCINFNALNVWMLFWIVCKLFISFVMLWRTVWPWFCCWVKVR